MSKFSEISEGILISDDRKLIDFSDASAGYIQVQLQDYENSNSISSSIMTQQLDNLDCIVIFPGSDAHMSLSGGSSNGDQSSDPSSSSHFSHWNGAAITNASLSLSKIKPEKQPKKSVINKLIHSGPNSSDYQKQHDCSSMKSKGLITSDSKRKVSHNEVERKRRDQINTWIGELQSMLPEDKRQKSYHQSKGVILKTVAEYFKEVQQCLEDSQNLQTQTKQLELQNVVLKESMDNLKHENQQLKLQLEQFKRSASHSKI